MRLKKRQSTHLEITTQVKQILEVDSVEAANIFLSSGDWVLLNSYINKNINKKIPTIRLGRVK